MGSRSSTITRLGKSARSLQGERSRHAQACAVRIAVRVTDRLFESCKDRTNRGCIRHAPIDWNCKADTDRAVPSVRRSIDFYFQVDQECARRRRESMLSRRHRLMRGPAERRLATVPTRGPIWVTMPSVNSRDNLCWDCSRDTNFTLLITKWIVAKVEILLPGAKRKSLR